MTARRERRTPASSAAAATLASASASASAAAAETRVGIDFGMTIADMHSSDHRPYPNALLTIRALVCRFGPANVFIVSKAKYETSQLILAWLRRHGFYAATGMVPTQVHFVREYADKRMLVDRFRINYFVDDSIKVVKHLAGAPSIRKVVWFRGRADLLRQLPKGFRNSVVLSKSWNMLYKTFSKPSATAAAQADAAAAAAVNRP